MFCRSAKSIGVRWQGNRGVLAWGPTGVNVSGESPYYERPAALASYMPAARMKVWKDSGFDHVRLSVGMGPMMAAANDAAIDVHISKWIASLSALLGAGLMVSLNFAPDPWTGYTDSDIMSGTVVGAPFLRYEYVAGYVARYLNDHYWEFPPSHVALSLYNEMSSSTASVWYPMVKALWATARQQAPRHTLVVSPGAAGASNLLADMTPADFDHNTLYDVHSYLPATASRQGEVGTIWAPIDGLVFPPEDHPGGYAAALAQFETAYGDTAPSWVTGNFNLEGLRCYFGNSASLPATGAQNATWLRDYMFKIVADWRDSFGLPRSSIIIGEDGVNGFYNGRTNAPPNSVTALLAAKRAAAEYHGFRISYLAVDNPRGGVSDGWSNGYGLFYRDSPYEAANAAAVAAVAG